MALSGLEGCRITKRVAHPELVEFLVELDQSNPCIWRASYTFSQGGDPSPEYVLGGEAQSPAEAIKQAEIAMRGMTRDKLLAFLEKENSTRRSHHVMALTLED